MRHATLVVEHAADIGLVDTDSPVVDGSHFLSRRSGDRHSLVVNLCDVRDYLSLGYYCSLIAEARGQPVIPAASTLSVLQQGPLQRAMLKELSAELALLREGGALARRDGLIVVFGRAVDPALQPLADRAFAECPCPLLSIQFDDAMEAVVAIRVMGLSELPDSCRPALEQGLRDWTRGPAKARDMRPHATPSIAILHDPDEELPPSRAETLRKFREVGARMGMRIALIRHGDAAQLSAFDALFIRETTGVRHASFRFAKSAERHGQPVIDDSQSILHCGNKIYLAELLQRHHIPTPRSLTTSRAGLAEAAEQLGYPLVLKKPDGSSGIGVVKVDNPEALAGLGRDLFRHSSLIVAQEWMYTPFDWRVGVLAGKPIFVCRYRMARDHWQIFHHIAGRPPEEGATEAVPMRAVPRQVLAVAVQAAEAVGDGLYGVDLKETDDGVFVVEVNDNPNIDVGLEDAVEGDDLYRNILNEFRRRLDLAV